MKKYEKPMAVAVNGMSEGVYMASGALNDCWRVTNYYVEGGGEPDEVKGHVQCTHYATYDHHSTEYTVAVTFSNAIIGVKDAEGDCIPTFSGNTAYFLRTAHHECECVDTFGFAVLLADPGLKDSTSITKVECYGCNRVCDQHTPDQIQTP